MHVFRQLPWKLNIDAISHSHDNRPTALFAPQHQAQFGLNAVLCRSTKIASMTLSEIKLKNWAGENVNSILIMTNIMAILMLTTCQFTAKCKGYPAIALKQQI